MNAILRLAAPVLATFTFASVAACSHADPEPPRPAAAELPEGAEALVADDSPATPGGFFADPSLRTEAPGGEGVLVGLDGRGVDALPPEVLADVRAQLRAAGALDAVAQIDRRYDLATGKAKDAAHARSVVLAQGGAK